MLVTVDSVINTSGFPKNSPTTAKIKNINSDRSTHQSTLVDIVCVVAYTVR
ncbi:MAG: hypothetical protein VKL60_13300 [Sphaerospermopsis sp.]|uniref:hypothetical protein n=1 Tax=Sphaerospermopsis reniformis TaxID=531300 RepID=UPI0013969CB0|nr:hypothetical protein [Sphaerospermopsis reniformis]MEB3149986.1 hypothetical protein [Sphaerospermopsis sp.]